MFKTPTAESPKTYTCTVCAMIFPTSQSFAGHHNAHRARHRWRHLSQAENSNTYHPALAEPKDGEKPATLTDLIISGRQNDDKHNCRPFYTFMPPAKPAPTSTSESERGQDRASGSSTTGSSSYGENPKKRRFPELAKLRTGAADKSWLKL